MQANTKQVREIMRNAIELHVGGGRIQTWTNKPSKHNKQVRSVCMQMIVDRKKADTVLAEVQWQFAKLQYTNTACVSECSAYSALGMGFYLRCNAIIA